MGGGGAVLRGALVDKFRLGDGEGEGSWSGHTTERAVVALEELNISAVGVRGDSDDEVIHVGQDGSIVYLKM